jgi:hypothetical protein
LFWGDYLVASHDSIATPVATATARRRAFLVNIASHDEASATPGVESA